MNEKARYMTFYENWVELKKMCSPEEWYELEDIIFQLRFEGIDTDPKTINNIKIKAAWIVIRPSILKSNRNTRYQDNKGKKNTDITPNEDFDTPTTNNDTTPNTMMTTNLPNNRIDEDQITEEGYDNHSKGLNDFLDENEKIIRQSTDIIAKSIAVPNMATEKTAKFYKEKLMKMKEELGTITQDAIDFEKFVNEEIVRKARNIKYEKEGI